MEGLSWESLSVDYASYHTTKGNRVCHLIGIPLIILALVRWTQVGPLSPVPLLALVLPVYLYWGVRLALGMAALVGALSWLAVFLNPSAALGAFILGWGFQALGHAVFEKKSAAFQKNLVHLLVGPAWIIQKAGLAPMSVVFGAPVLFFAVVASTQFPRDVRSFLAGADKVELLSLDPYSEDGRKLPAESSFHGWRILGRTVLAESEVRRLRWAMWWGAGTSLGPAMCFNPRHGIRAESGGQALGVVVCFECSQLVIWRDGSQEGKGDWRLTGSFPERTFNALLTRHGVSLPEH